MADYDIQVNIVEKLGVLSISKSGWTKELNLVSWNGKKPKFDIREWDEDHLRMSRGTTLTEEELETIVRLYSEHKARKAK